MVRGVRTHEYRPGTTHEVLTIVDSEVSPLEAYCDGFKTGDRVRLLPLSREWTKTKGRVGTISAKGGNLIKVDWDPVEGLPKRPASIVLPASDCRLEEDNTEFKWTKYVKHERAGICEVCDEGLCQQMRGRLPASNELFMRVVKTNGGTPSPARDGYYLGAVHLCRPLGDSLPPDPEKGQIWIHESRSYDALGIIVKVISVGSLKVLARRVDGGPMSKPWVRVDSFLDGSLRYLGNSLKEAGVRVVKIYTKVCFLCGGVSTAWDENGELISVGHICQDEDGDKPDTADAFLALGQ